MESIEVIDRDYNLDWGFAWIELRIDGEEAKTLQLCLEQRANQGKTHIKAFVDDCERSGFTWGSCWDANEMVIEKIGQERAFKLLKKELREMGIRRIA